MGKGAGNRRDKVMERKIELKVLDKEDRELTAAELDAVTGGKATPKLLEAACKGKVFKKVEIHGTA
jgi:type VI protein secretion system component Hcp